MSLPRSGVTELLRRAHEDRGPVLDQLIELLYDELRAQAVAMMRSERDGHTLQPTAVVHEVYLRLFDHNMGRVADRDHFMVLAARTLRRVLIDHARTRGRRKRGGSWLRVELDAIADVPREYDVAALDDAMARLEAISPLQSSIVELRCFGMLTIEQISRMLGVPRRTVEREWQCAKIWLCHKLMSGC